MIDDTLTCGSKAVFLIDRHITRKLVIKTILKIEELINCEDEMFDENLFILIDSEGGDIEPTFFLYNYLCNLKTIGIDTITNALGECKSSALLIFAAGTERVCGLDTTFMIHDSMFSSDERSTKEMLAYAKYLDYQSSRYYEAIADITNLDAKYFEEQVTNKNEWYFDGRIARNLGIATVLIGEEYEDEQSKATETQCSCSKQALDSNSHNNCS